MQIVLTTWGFPTPFSQGINGIAVYTAVTARTLARLGHDVTVITSHAEGMPQQYSTEAGVTVYQAPPGNIHWFLYKARCSSAQLITYVKLWEIGRALVHKLRTLANDASFDVVEVGLPATFLYAAALQDMKTVSTIHGCPDLFREVLGQKPVFVDRLWDYITRKAAARGRLLVAPSRYIAEHYSKRFGRRPFVLPLPVDTEMAVETEVGRSIGSEVNIIALGGTGFTKGGDVVARSMVQVMKRHTNVRLSVISGFGSGLFLELQRRFKERVQLLPWMPHRQLMHRFTLADIFVSASRFETFGMTVAEAMSTGLCVVVSDIPTHTELIGDNERGLVFKSGSPNSLASALMTAIENPTSREMLAERARQWARTNLDPVVLTQKRLEVYSS